MKPDRRISVIGLGYVGLPVATAFGRAGLPVVAFDISRERVEALRRGEDHTREIDAAALAEAKLRLTTDPDDLADADFHIVTVPTPIDGANRPDLGPLLAATRTVGRRLKRGDIVVYESTVYPGATENECAPLLAAESGLIYGEDFSVGYSPERINPGDHVHRFENIVKVVSGGDRDTLEIVARTYGRVVRAGVHKASSIAVAEAAKVIENTQRDLNIALMNELSLIFSRLGIDTHDVLAAAGTKWNFLKFTPGLVGGHCIGVDPYYLTHRAEQVGYHPDVILAGRRTNDAMGQHVARETVKRLLATATDGEPRRVAVLGLSFKENVPDLRNTRVIDIVRELQSFSVDVEIHDPLCDPDEALAEYGVRLTPMAALQSADAVVLAVPHDDFAARGWALPVGLLKAGKGLVVDVKGCLDRNAAPDGVTLWRL
jgi:UDP-N-acetyl-D-glucosamine/UDP-N-acetyl-D-galactosamine dehydrogenase